MIDILIDATPLGASPGYRGVGTYIRELLAGLVGQLDLTLAALIDGETPLPAGVRPVHVHRRAPGRLRQLERDLLLPRELARTHADVVHCPDTDPPRRCPAPFVQTLYDVIPLVIDDPALAAARRRWQRQLAGRYRRADAVIAISRHAADEGIRLLGLDPRRVTVSPLGVGRAFTASGPAYEPADDVPYLLVVGEHSRRKGFAEAFAVIGALADAGYPHRLKIAGRIAPWVRPTLESVVAAAPHPERIDLLDWVPDLPALYRGATLVLVTSRYEGFGLPAAEAMACGVAVVSFANSSLVEVVADGGALVPDGDVGAFVAEARGLLDDMPRRLELGERGRQRAAVFDWGRCAASHADVYRAVAS